MCACVLYVLSSTMYGNDSTVVGGAVSSSSSMLAMLSGGLGACADTNQHKPPVQCTLAVPYMTTAVCYVGHMYSVQKMSVLLWVVGTSCTCTVLGQNLLA